MKEGLKLDKGKARWDLLPFEEVEDVVDILTFGAEKYAPNNWQKVDNAKSRYLAATFRHLVSWIKGDKTDKESGKSHLAHACCNILFLMWFDRHQKKEVTYKENVDTSLTV